MSMVVLALLTGMSGPTRAAEDQGLRGPLAPLPTGNLLMISGNAIGMAFLAIDQIAKRGSIADIWTLTVLAEPLPLSAAKSSADYVRHMSIDCEKHTFSIMSEDVYDAEDRWVIWMPPRRSSEIKPSSVQDFMARVVCNGESPPLRIIVHGPKEAREMTKVALAFQGRH